MQIIPRMAAALQDLLTVTATEIGTQCPLIKRQREFTASSLLATFVLGFLQRPKPTWDHLALIARQLGANVTPQAVLQRVTPVLADALAQLWQAAVGCVVTATPRATPLLAKFTQVLIGDSTTIRLADEMASQFPGCGGSHGFGRAALKLQVIWDYLSGQLCRMRCEAGKQNDSTSPVMDETPAAGSLSIFDLGYFSLERFAGWQAAGAHWISRGISDLLVWTDNASRDLHEWLQTQPAGPIDRWVEVGEARLRCRIVALRAAGSRRATASKGVRQGRQERPATDRQTSGHLRLDRVSHVVCRRPVDLAGSRRLVSRSLADRTVVQVVEVARLDRRTSLGRPVRQLVELYAKLIAAIVQHWLILVACWSDDRVSLTKASRLLRDQLPQLIAALGDFEQLVATLTHWADILPGLARLATRRSQPSNPQLLANPELLSYYA